MSKQQLSAAIAEAERKDPSLAKRRQRIADRRRENEFGPELIAAERAWSEFAETVEFMIAAYRKGKGIIVDVLRVNEAFISEKGRLTLGVERPRVLSDRRIGDHLDWDQSFELNTDALCWHEPLHRNFYEDGVPAYQQAVNRGLKAAKKL